MANSTDPFAESVHGTNPQYLVEKITRLKIYNCDYWKSECFGLTSETIVDKAVALKYCGGIYGGNMKPSNFLALTLKMLQLQPEKDIIIAFIQNADFKYLRILGAVYMRLVGNAVDVYKYLEPLYNDYRKIAYRTSSGWSLKHIDEFIDSLLHDELVCDIALPHLQKRIKLEDQKILRPRKSALDLELSSLKNDSNNIAVSFDDDESFDPTETIPLSRGLLTAINQDINGELNNSEMKNKLHMKLSRQNEANNSDNVKRLCTANSPLANKYVNQDDRDNDINYEDSTLNVNRNDNLNLISIEETEKRRNKLESKITKRFDKLFKSSKSSNSNDTNKRDVNQFNNPKVEEFSVEYWNQRRESLGLKKLK